MVDNIEIDGRTISVDELKIEKARELANSLQDLKYVSLVCCLRKRDGIEAIVFDVEVEVPQKIVHDIRRVERLAVKFDPQDESLPDTLALRSDFPLVPHLNMRAEDFPRSLCIFEASYSEIKLRWTAPFYIRNVRRWLALTARGELHAEDQPLEPLLSGSEGYLILPPDITDPINSIQMLTIECLNKVNSQYIFRARIAESFENSEKDFRFLITFFYAKPQKHGVIQSKPKNLLELHDYLGPVGIDFIEKLRKRLLKWNTFPFFDALKNARLIILILLPKKRNIDDLDFETTEFRAFLTTNSIVEIGSEIEIWDVHKGDVGLLINTDLTKTGNTVQLGMLNVIFDLSAERAALLNGLNEKTDIQITAIGLGALGSQVILNLLRMGYGRWKFIDHDVLLPHNLARHGLTDIFVGFAKTIGISRLACQMLNDSEIATPFVENVIKPSSPDALEVAFADAQVILDISTSIAVARSLVYDIESDARRISLFLNPTATDVVMLAEDDNREVGLDLLEMIYYRELIQNPHLQKHLQLSDNKIRFGTSCRDLSSKIPQDMVALHSAICSRAFRQIIENGHSTIGIWCADPDEMTTQKYDVKIGREIRNEINGWMIVTDDLFLGKISQMRASKLPNETGGVLIGNYDINRKVIYVIDTIPAPPDSFEWPTIFIRGARGLRQKVQQVQKISGNQLDYVGEWHSHSSGIGARPSKDDMIAFAWLAEMMGKEGLPALMLISARNENNFYIEKMEKN